MLERARITAQRDGIKFNRVHLLDGTFIQATEKGLVTFYGSRNSPTERAAVMDPNLLARLPLVFFFFQIKGVKNFSKDLGFVL